MSTALTVCEGDVYRFRYNAEEMAKRFEPHHCFDGQLVARGGKLIDTYWGFDHLGDCGRVFTPEEAERLGTLSLVCNLSEVVAVQKWQFAQYAEADRFDLSHQHGCYGFFVVRRGAVPSCDVRLGLVREKQKQLRHDIDYAVRMLEHWAVVAHRLEAGEDVSVST